MFRAGDLRKVADAPPPDDPPLRIGELLDAGRGGCTVTDWQPIDTAPKSTSTPVPGGGAHVRGAYFLGYCPDESATDPVSCICICWWEPHIGKGKWWGEGDYELRPTHWMPLPDPPCEHPKEGAR
jgi:hypothetical protein